MLNYCTKCLTAMPEITVYMNCDTRLAINLRLFDLGDYDEFIFTIKNFNYTDSSCVFLFRATKADIDENGEVIFKIDPDVSKNIKPGAFYTFSLLANAHNKNMPTEHIKLTPNGKVIIEYGAHDLALPESVEHLPSYKEILAARIEPTDSTTPSAVNGAIAGLRLEELIDKN